MRTHLKEGLLRKVCTFQREHVMLQEYYKFSKLNMELVLHDKNNDSSVKSNVSSTAEI